MVLFVLLFVFLLSNCVSGNEPPRFVRDMNNWEIPEQAAPGSIVYQLVGEDAESEVLYGLGGTDSNYLAVDELTGTVMLIQPLDGYRRPILNVVVSLRDMPINGAANNISRSVTVRVVGIPDPPSTPQQPLFSPPLASVEVKENWPPKVPLPFSQRLFVFSPPSLESKTLQLFVLSQDPKVAGSFITNPTSITGSGHFDILISDSKFMDLENKRGLGNQFGLEIEALEPNSGVSTRLPVRVVVLDSNEHKPTFFKHNYRFNVPETAVEGAFVGAVSVSDSDRGIYGLQGLVYHLYGTYAKYFTLESRPRGKVELRYNPCPSPSMKCDADVMPIADRVTLVLRVTDTNGTGMYSDVEVTVEILRQDTHGPYFLRSYYMRFLLEGSSEFHPLLQVQAVDKDGSRLTYALEDTTNVFGINPDTGIVFVQHPQFVNIAEMGMRFNLTAVASDRRNRPARVDIVIEIHEKKESRNRAPMFSMASYEMELEAGKTILGRVLASDVESNVTYSIAEGGAGYFHLDPITGDLAYRGPTLTQNNNYTIHVLAMDGVDKGKVGSAVVVAEVEGLGSVPPLFDTPTIVQVTAKENAMPGTHLWTFTATDKDRDAYLVYSVVRAEAWKREGAGLLGGGSVEERDWRELFVFGNRGFSNGTLFLARDVATPDILSFHVTVTVEDAAHAEEPKDTAYLIVVVEPLSAEEKMRNEELMFMPIPPDIAISETTPTQTYVYTAALLPTLSRHKDKSGAVLYSLTDGIEQFIIHPISGVIRVRQPLDGMGVVNVTVVAQHMASMRSISQSFMVDCFPQNNHSPTFAKTSYNIKVTENAPVGSFLLTITATDKDKDTIVYRLTGTHADFFSVDEVGNISTKKELDREERKAMDLYLEAIDTGNLISKVPVMVEVEDVNDNAPVLTRSKYSAEVMENSPEGSHLLHVQAFDPDKGANGSVQYSLVNVENQELKQALSIDPAEGVLTNVKPLRGLHGNHSFGAVATDGGGRNKAAVVFLTIQPTQSCHPTIVKPRLNESIIWIKENMEPGYLLTTFKATTEDRTCDLRYVIWDPTEKQYVASTETFEINEANGELKTRVALDREVKESYTLIVAVNSGALYAQTLVEVRVKDVNDNLPSFPVRSVTWSVAEDVEVGSVVGKISAQDPDQLDHGRLFYHLFPDKDPRMKMAVKTFTLDMESGELRVGGRLDRESVDVYWMWAVATNSPFTPSRQYVEEVWKEPFRMTEALRIILRVNDVNDNGPQFEESQYVMAASVDSPIGYVLTQVHAEDPDKMTTVEKRLSVVEYEISSSVFVYKQRNNSLPGVLSIDRRTGELQVAAPLDTYVNGLFHLNIRSSDSPNPLNAQTHSARVMVWVYAPSQLVRIVVHSRPESITTRQADEILQSLAKTVKARVLLRGVEYHEEQNGRVGAEKVDLLALFINDSTSQIIPTPTVLNLVDVHGNMLRKMNVLQVNRASGESVEGEGEKMAEGGLSAASIGLVVFGCILFFGLLGFSLLLCYLRYQFLREKEEVTRKPPPPQKLPPPSAARIAANSKQNPLWADSRLPDVGLPPKGNVNVESEKIPHIKGDRNMSQFDPGKHHKSNKAGNNSYAPDREAANLY